MGNTCITHYIPLTFARSLLPIPPNQSNLRRGPILDPLLQSSIQSPTITYRSTFSCFHYLFIYQLSSIFKKYEKKNPSTSFLMGAGSYSYLNIEHPNISIVWSLLSFCLLFLLILFDVLLATTNPGWDWIGSKSAYSKIKHYHGLLSTSSRRFVLLYLFHITFIHCVRSASELSERTSCLHDSWRNFTCNWRYHCDRDRSITSILLPLLTTKLIATLLIITFAENGASFIICYCCTMWIRYERSRRSD